MANTGRDEKDNPSRSLHEESETSDLLRLFAPPSRSRPTTLATIPSMSEVESLLPTSNDGAKNKVNHTNNIPPDLEHNVGLVIVNDGVDESDQDVASTIRRVNNSARSITGDNRPELPSPSIKKYGSVSGENDSFFSEDGIDLFLKIKTKRNSVTAQRQNGLNTSRVKSNNCAAYFQNQRVLGKIKAFLTPLACVSTWVGSIMFVLYHVVFCMANGCSIARPKSGVNMIGDMARYTAVGIIASCPFLVYSLSDNDGKNRIGIPAMYPSVDLFLAPFLAEAAAVIDKCIMNDFESGQIVIPDDQDNHELYLTRLWFGSFAAVVSFGMFASGCLLILASKFKLANLGTYLPYGVLCGFFSSVGMLLWKLAISIDKPSGDKNIDWKTFVVHHLPSFSIGIAMNRLGPQHPFFVTGLILFTIAVFYSTMYIMGISLEEAQQAGWFYSKEELQSSSFPSKASTSSSNTSFLLTSDSHESQPYYSTWFGGMLPPHPLGVWFAILQFDVHWKAVWRASKDMTALSILYLLRASIHAAALKKNVHNLVRRVPVAQEKTDPDITTIHHQDTTEAPRRHRRNTSMDSMATGITLVLEGASNLFQSVRNEVQIVNMSLTDRQSLKGKVHRSPRRQKHPNRSVSATSHTTAIMENITRKSTESVSNLFPSQPIPPIPPRNPIQIDFTTRGGANDEESSYLEPPPLNRDVSGLTDTKMPSTRANHTSQERNKHTSINGSISGNDEQSLMQNLSRTDLKRKKIIEVDDGMDYEEICAPSTNMTLEEIFSKYGHGLLVTAGFGGFGCCPTIATSITMYAVGAGAAAPQYFSVILLLLAFYSSGFEIVRFIPKAACSSLLVLGAFDNFMIWCIRPMSKMSNMMEWSVVPFIVLFSLLTTPLEAIFLGIGLSTFLFVADFFRVGVVKYDASGREIRSRIERSLGQSIWLDDNGEFLRVIVLQNYLFFGNASSLFRYIETMFEDISQVESHGLGYPLPPIPVVLVLDLSLVTGMDTSTVDAFLDIWRICKASECRLYLCGVSPRLKRTFAKGGMKPETKGPKKYRTLMYFSDLDHGLGRAEDVLMDMKMSESEDVSLLLLKKGDSGFHTALQHIDQLHSITMADGLLGLESYTRRLMLQQGEKLFEKDGGKIPDIDRGLFFIESGMVRVDDDSARRTNTRTGGSLRRLPVLDDNTLNGKHARLGAAARRAAIADSSGNNTTSHLSKMRIATIGPGWVIGTNEFATGQQWQNKLKAVTHVTMHHLRFTDLTRLEEEDPVLLLRLYKMLTLVMARKEEDTVAHLSTLHNILSSAPNLHPIPRLSTATYPAKN